ncbi:hypothetical protein AAY84_25595 [Serratia marcescens]|nr:hypothetical protein AAY84_25595 [Serratia marcescens]
MVIFSGVFLPDIRPATAVSITGGKLFTAALLLRLVEMIILYDWLTESGIASAEQLEVTAASGVLRLQRREVDVFRA